MFKKGKKSKRRWKVKDALKVLPGYQGNVLVATALAVIVFAITFSAVS